MKQILVLSILFLFIGIAIAPSINISVVKASDDNDLVEVTNERQSDISTEYKLAFPTQGLWYYVSPFFNYLKNGISYGYLKILRDWNGKSFPNTTVMLIGGGVGVIPCYNVTIVIKVQHPFPSKIDVYSDGEYYITIYPRFCGPISVRQYIVYYYEKGFHHLLFVGDDNTSLSLDVQIGWNGFIHNILPYLLKTNIVGKETI
jgi:hypothetical protein